MTMRGSRNRRRQITTHSRRTVLGALMCASAGFLTKPLFGMCTSTVKHPLNGIDVLGGMSTTNSHMTPIEGAVEFESSDETLVSGFHWAKEQALKYVENGDPVGPWYEAGLPGRNAFCMRDVSHMSTGAQILGLQQRTKNMLGEFAKHISASKRWCSWWEIDLNGRPAPIDYKNDHDFWYDLPASFDVLDACFRQFLWTRDHDYLASQFLNFYERTVTDYVKAWDSDGDGLLDHLPIYGHMGIATYDEDLNREIKVGADLVAAQFAGYRAYSMFQQLLGNESSSEEFMRKANQLKNDFNQSWWDDQHKQYFAAIGNDGHFAANLKPSVGGTDVELPLYFRLIEGSSKIDFILAEMAKRLVPDKASIGGIIGGVEGRTYLPEIFYSYNRPNEAYRALTTLMNPSLKRREYPEVSYTVIGNFASGLVGLAPSMRQGVVETFPQLTDKVQWVRLQHVPIVSNVVSIQHRGNSETTFTNESGATLIWRAGFYASPGGILVDGKRARSESSIYEDGITKSYTEIVVPPGESRVAVRT